MHIGEIGCPCGLPDEPPCRQGEYCHAPNESPTWGTEDYRRWACLFNDITKAPIEWHDFSTANALTRHLWTQGWRRDVRPEDVTEGQAAAKAQDKTRGNR
jgi:hypothetical protein